MKPLLLAALSATLCAQAAPAGEAIPPALVHSVRTAAKQNFCEVDPKLGQQYLRLSAHRYLLWYAVDGEKEDGECNYGSATGHIRVDEAVYRNGRWHTQANDVISRINRHPTGINPRFISRIRLGANGTLLIEANELSEIGNTPGKNYRYTVRLRDWRVIRRQAIP
ncbi:MAG: hypothetical protein Q4A62_09290 [Eikenella sp.]|nr:hypothetical protein [Eikenella sp.]